MTEVPSSTEATAMRHRFASEISNSGYHVLVLGTESVETCSIIHSKTT